MLIAGADGCPGGWVVVTAEFDPTQSRCHHLAAVTTSELDAHVEMTRTGSLAALAIDMPIGLLDEHPRTADLEARRLLGERRSSVFPTPIAATLDASDYAHACARSRAVCGKALSKQAWNLMPKIRQLDQLITADDQRRVAEAHPECAFVRLQRDEPLGHSKATQEGQALRQRLLTEAALFDAVELDELLADRHPTDRVAPRIDLLDALALVSTARHLALGTERRLGDQVDARGRRAEIVL